MKHVKIKEVISFLKNRVDHYDLRLRHKKIHIKSCDIHQNEYSRYGYSQTSIVFHEEYNRLLSERTECVQILSLFIPKYRDQLSDYDLKIEWFYLHDILKYYFRKFNFSVIMNDGTSYNAFDSKFDNINDDWELFILDIGSIKEVIDLNEKTN